jgi:para-nitrobenzyl esterase
MFWIHGGGFTAGSSQELPSYDGENLAKKGDVVVVSINHRLNVLGFLDLSAYGEKYKYSANSSVLDMKAALEWVQANIANFGGDANNITIFGQSGGGAKVNTLMAMPSAKGLFHKAIGAAVLKELNISADKVDEIQNVPFEQLSAASSKALKTVSDELKANGKPAGGFGLNWGPSVDGDALPYQLFSDEAFGLSKNIPLLIGTTVNEFAVFRGGVPKGNTNEQAYEVIKQAYGDKTDAYIAAVKKAYSNAKMTQMLDYDVMFRPGAVKQANQKSEISGGAPTYMYLFDWQSPVMNGKYKAVHCMEIAFCFDNIQRTKNMTGGTKEAQKLADKMSSAWINFACLGNPNHESLPVWPAYNSSSTATMHFDNSCVVKPQMDKELFELIGQ